MKIFFIVLFIFFTNSFSILNESNGINIEEYKIYSTIIDSSFTYSSTTNVVINDSTNFDYVFGKKTKYKNGLDSLYLLNYIKMSGLADSLEIYNNYIKNNRRKYKLDVTKFSTIAVISLLKQSIFHNYFNEGIKKGWNSFYVNHPESTGYLKFCRVGFNNKRDIAFVYVEQFCGGVCGYGGYFILEYQNDNWKIIKEIETWVN